MRGEDLTSGALFSYVDVEARIPAKHPLRTMRRLTNGRWLSSTRGFRRLHKRPNAGEIKICRRWVFEEIDTIGPRLIVALGATAAQSLAGRAISVQANRGKILDGTNGVRIFMTIHPSALLRLQDEDEKRSAYASFVNGLRSIERLAEPSTSQVKPDVRKAG